MASALPVDNDTYELIPGVTSEGNTSSWGDYWQQVKGAGYGVASGLLGAVDIVDDPLRDRNVVDEQRAAARGWLDTKQREAFEAMTPQGLRNAQASFLPKEGAGNDIFDPNVSARSKVAGTVLSAAPSIVASILGTVVGGPVLGYGLAGAMDAGSTYNAIRKELEGIPDDKLRQTNDLYAGLRDMGWDERQARAYLLDQTARNKALLVGTFSAATSRFGAEGIAARALGGHTAAETLARSTAKGALGEGLEEAGQQAVQSFAEQKGKAEVAGDPNRPIDWYDLANETLEATVGGLGAGGATGGVSHAFVKGLRKPAGAAPGARPPDIDPAIPAAVAPSQAAPAPVQPPTTPEDVVNATAEERVNAPPQALAATPAAPALVPDTTNDVVGQVTAPRVQAPDAVGPTERAALAPDFDPELGEEAIDSDVEPSAAPPAPLTAAPPAAPTARILEPRVQEAIGASPDVAIQPPATPQVASVADVMARASAAEPLPSEVTSAPEPAPAPAAPAAPAVTPTAPGAARVLEDVAAKKRERKGARMTPAKQAQIDRGETEIVSARKDAARQAKREKDAVAQRMRTALQETAPPEDVNDLKALRTYVSSLVEKAGDIPIKGKAMAGADPALQLYATAKALRVGPLAKLQEYMNSDLAFRRGDEHVIGETRSAQAAKAAPAPVPAEQETAVVQGAEVPETAKGTAGASSAALQEKERLETEAVAKVDKERAATRRDQLLAEIKRREEARKEATRAKGAAIMAAQPDAVRAGQNKAGTFKVETRGRKPKTPRTEAEATEQLQEQRAQEEAASRPIRDPLAHLSEEQKKEMWDEMIEAARADEIKRKDDAEEAKDPEGFKLRKVAKWAATLTPEERAWMQEKFGEGRGKSKHTNVGDYSYPNAPGLRAADAIRFWNTMLDSPAQRSPRTTSTLRENVSPGVAAFMRARQRAAEGKEKVNIQGRTATVAKGVSFDEALAGIRVDRLPRLQRNLVNFYQAWISPLIPDTRVYMVDHNDYVHLHGPAKKPSSAFHWAGHIVVNRDALLRSDGTVDPQLLAHNLVHEGLHGALEDEIDANPIAKHRIEMIQADMRAALDRRMSGLADQQYGLRGDAHEFISELGSNPAFVQMASETKASPELLRDLGYKRQDTSIWQTFVSLVRGILELDPKDISILEVGLRETESLFHAANAREGQAAPRILRDIGVQGAKNAYSDTSEAMSLGARGMGIRIAPFHHIVTQFDKLFEGRPLDRIERALDKAYMRSQALVEEASPHITSWIELTRKNAQEAIKAAHAVTAITTGNMNPIDKIATKAELLKANSHFGDIKSDKATLYARRGQLEHLNNDLWMGLQPETRAIIRKAAQYFKDAHNGRTRMFLRKVLTLAKPEVLQNPQILNDIISHTMTGKLTEDDRAHIGDNNLFKILQNAQEFRQIEGMYFPLLRHGSHVVTTLDKIGNLHGGKLEDEDIVEFRAATDKDARAAYRRFMEDPANRDVTQHTSAAKRRYMGDKVVSAADATGQTHDVAYRVRVQRKGMYMFSSARKAAAFRREHGHLFDETSRVMKKDEAEQTGDLASRDITALNDLIDRRTDIAAGTRNLLKSLTREVSIMQLSGNRIQQRQLPRRNVKGASQDIALNIMTYAQASANAVARFENMDDLREALDDMHKQVVSRSDNEPAQRDLIKEVNYRFLDPNLNPKAPPQWVRTGMLVSYLSRLFDAAYSVMNATQVWTVSLHNLGGEYGFMRTGVAINRAYNDIAGIKQIISGVANTVRAANPLTFFNLKINTTDVLGSIRKNLEKDKGALAALDNAIERGKIDPDAGQEIEHASIIGRSRVGKFLASVDRIMRQLPQAVEAINRATTIVAAYRLAKAAGATHAEAVDKSFDVMMATQGDYSVRNTPKAIFQNPWLSPAAQFKKYGLMQGALMQDMLKRAGGRTATPAERKIAFKQIAGMITVQMLFAGSSGLPGLELIKVPLMVAGLFGLGGGYDEWARKVRKYMDEAIGKKPAELLSSGILSRAVGVDLSGKMSLSDILLHGEPKRYDEDGVLAYIASIFLGSPGGMVLEWQKGIEAAGNGEWAKAASLMLPLKFAQDTAKAIHKYGKGDINKAEAVGQALGFRSGRMAEEGAETGDRIKASQKADKDRKELTQRYIEADAGELPAIRKEIDAHNKRTLKDENGKEFPLPQRLRVHPKGLDAARVSKDIRRKKLRGE